MQLKNSFFSILNKKEDDGKQTYRIELQPEHIIFKAHFPGNPIVPGVCQVHIVGELLEETLGRKVFLSEVKNIKYLAVMSPATQTVYDVTFQKIQEAEDTCKVIVVYSDEEKPYAKLSMTYSYNNI